MLAFSGGASGRAAFLDAGSVLGFRFRQRGFRFVDGGAKQDGFASGGLQENGLGMTAQQGDINAGIFVPLPFALDARLAGFDPPVRAFAGPPAPAAPAAPAAFAHGFVLFNGCRLGGGLQGRIGRRGAGFLGLNRRFLAFSDGFTASAPAPAMALGTFFPAIRLRFFDRRQAFIAGNRDGGGLDGRCLSPFDAMIRRNERIIGGQTDG